MQFSQGFFTVLVHVSVVLAALGGMMLLALLIRDFLKRSVW